MRTLPGSIGKVRNGLLLDALLFHHPFKFGLELANVSFLPWAACRSWADMLYFLSIHTSYALSPRAGLPPW
jgi:hypothetical protein